MPTKYEACRLIRERMESQAMAASMSHEIEEIEARNEKRIAGKIVRVGMDYNTPWMLRQEMDDGDV